jgi:hypothetical protein
LSRVTRREAEQGTGDPLHAAMLLCNDIVQLWHLPDEDRGPLCRVVSPDGGGMGLAPTHGERHRDTGRREGLGEAAQGGLLTPRRCAGDINGLPGRVDGTLQAAPGSFTLMGVSSVRRLRPTGRLRRCKAAASRGVDRRPQWLPVAWPTETPRAGISSSRRRQRKGQARSHRTQVRRGSVTT